MGIEPTTAPQFYAELRTKLAASSLTGRARSGTSSSIIGMLAFASMTRDIWHHAGADDPFADWWLLRIEKKLDHVRAAVDATITQLDPMLASLDGLVIDLNAQPVLLRRPLRFACPLAFDGARLIMLFDQMVLRLNACTQVGVLAKKDASRLLYKTSGSLTAVWLSAKGYTPTGLTRERYTASAAERTKAEGAMGELPPEVLVCSALARCRADRAALARLGAPAHGDDIVPLSPADMSSHSHP